jgi:membrane protein YqaA with SNARE-associated domain
MRTEKAAFLGGMICILLAIAISGNKAWFGALLGYWLSFISSKFLYRDTEYSVQVSVPEALKRMHRGFFLRLGAISLVVVGIARFQTAWLPSLVAGIAVGIPVSLIFILRRHILNGKG